MRRTLSTPLTFFMKFIFSTMWFVAADILAVHGRGHQGPGAAAIAAAVLAFWEYSRIKHVEITDESMRVSNCFRSEVIPLENIERVSENLFLYSHPVYLHLIEPCSFGTRIVVMPNMLLLSFRPHPVVRQINTALRGRVEQPQ